MKKPIKILTLDTETIGLHGALRRIAIYDGIKVYYGYKFEDVKSCLDAYYESGFDIHIYIHNLEFDIRKIDIFGSEKILWEKSVIINKHYVKVACEKYTFHDSFRIIPGKLASITKDFQLEHAKLDLLEEVKKAYGNRYVNEVDFLSNCNIDDPIYLKYLGYDVISLYELIYKLMEISGLKEEIFVRILTTASLSKYLFKNGYKGHIFRHSKRKTDYQYLTDNKKYSYDKDIKFNYSNTKITYPEIEKIIRKAYVGGRTEVFKPYTGIPSIGYTAKHYDFNSLYPYAMSNNVFPYGEPEYYEGEICKNIFDSWLKYSQGLGFIEAEVYVPKQNIPPLPVKKGKLVFLTGHIKGVWTYPELKYAIENCGVKILKYLKCIHFPKTCCYFRDFVLTLYKLKEYGKNTGNKALTTFAKLILNCAYGWTGLNREDKTQLISFDKKERYENIIVSQNEKLGFCEIESTILSESVQVAAAAYVTSYGRLDLLKILKDCDAKGIVYYCDTDSIVTNVEIDSKLIHPTKLGLLDLEKIVYEGIFIQPKLYYEIGLERKKGSLRFSTTKKHKGVRKIDVDYSLNTFNMNKALYEEKFVAGVYENIFKLLKEGSNSKIVVEKNRESLRSVLCTQKENIDINSYRVTDKGFNLANIQKRNMNYVSNFSEPWHCNSLEDFEELSFVKKFPYEKYGALINPISKCRKCLHSN